MFFFSFFWVLGFVERERERERERFFQLLVHFLFVLLFIWVSFHWSGCSVHFLVPESQHFVWILGEHSATQREIAR